MQTSATDLRRKTSLLPKDRVFPVVRVVAYFTYQNATAVQSAPCSGFALTAKDYVVTSAHAITGFGAGTPKRVKVIFRAEKSWSSWIVWGTRVAWPAEWENTGLDIALVKLDLVPRQLVEPLRLTHVPDNESFAGNIRSVSKAVPVAGRRSGDWLAYDSPRGLEGYSGGPVQQPGTVDVFGVHVGRRTGVWGACACRSALIEPLERELSK